MPTQPESSKLEVNDAAAGAPTGVLAGVRTLLLRLEQRLPHPEARRFARFLLVGGLNTLFGYLVFALLVYVGLHYSLAALLSTIAGVIWNFHTTGKFVFDNIERKRIVRFVGVYAALYGLNLLGLRAGQALGYDAYLSGAAMLLPSAVVGYVLNKLWVFQA